MYVLITLQQLDLFTSNISVLLNVSRRNVEALWRPSKALEDINRRFVIIKQFSIHSIETAIS
jgi:hypothetical protein